MPKRPAEGELPPAKAPCFDCFEALPLEVRHNILRQVAFEDVPNLKVVCHSFRQALQCWSVMLPPLYRGFPSCIDRVAHELLLVKPLARVSILAEFSDEDVGKLVRHMKKILDANISRALADGSVDRMRLALDLGGNYNVNHMDESDTPSLITAAHRGFTTIASLLIERGANVEIRTPHSVDTPLLYAAEAGHVGIVRLLLRHHADIDARNDFGCSALSRAATFHHILVIHLLLAHGADIEAVNTFHCTALWDVLMSDNSDCRTCEATALYLLSRGASLDTGVIEPMDFLSQATRNGWALFITAMIRKGVDPTAPNRQDITPLEIAISHDHVHVVHVLLYHGVGLTEDDAYRSKILFLTIERGNVNILTILFQYGYASAINIPSTGGITPLMAACAKGHGDFIHPMLCYNADPEKVDDKGNTSLLHAAVLRGNPPPGRKFIRTPMHILLEFGVNVNAANSSGETPLITVARVGDDTDAHKLLRYGARVNDANVGGQTALIIAARGRYYALVAELVGHGAELHHVDTEGVSTLDWAVGDERMLEIFRQCVRCRADR